MSVWLMLIPAFTAITGWLLNKAIVYYLFGSSKTDQSAYPVAPFLLAKQKDLAETLPPAVVNRFLTPDKINALLTHADHFGSVKPVIEEHLDDFLRNRLKIVFPVIGMFIGDKTINELKGHFMVELEQLFPAVISKYAGSVVNPVEISALIRKEILDADIALFVHQHLKKEIKLVTLWGALTGFIIGLLVLLLLFLLM